MVALKKGLGRRRVPRAQYLAAVLIACLAATACEGGPVDADLAPAVPLRVQANALAGGVEVVVIEVTGPGIPVPIVANLAVVDGRASGTIRVPAGNDRTFTGRAFDTHAVLTHEGSITRDLRPGGPPLEIPMFPLGVGVPIQVTVGAFAVSIDPLTAEVEVGGTLQFMAHVLDAEGNELMEPALTWGSSNPAFAVVDGTGLVTGVHPGDATIVVSFSGVASAAELTVVQASEPEPGPSIVIEPFEGFVLVGQTIQFTATALDADGEPIPEVVFTWSSADAGVATVDANGLATGVGEGQVAIIAQAEGASGEATLTTAALEFAAVVPGSSAFTCGIDQGGAAYCWGSNTYGRLGTGDIDNRLLPTPVGGDHHFVVIAPGLDHTCAMDVDGQAFCWGRNASGRLGDGTTTDRLEPTPVAGGHTFDQIYAGYAHSCGITSLGDTYCWGWSGWGEIGAGPDTEQMSFPNPTLVVGGHVFARLALGQEVTCGITPEGKAYCWGSGSDGRRGDNDGYCCRTQPVAVATTSSFVDVTIQRAHGCGVTAAGDALCWGLNTSGQVGIGTTVSPQWVPVPVTGDHAFAGIVAGVAHTCAWTAPGVGYCWGSNNQGRLGDGTQTNRTAPTQITGSLVFVRVECGGAHTCGVTADGVAYCWGGNAQGQVGDGTTTLRTQPTRVAGQP